MKGVGLHGITLEATLKHKKNVQKPSRRHLKIIICLLKKWLIWLNGLKATHSSLPDNRTPDRGGKNDVQIKENNVYRDLPSFVLRHKWPGFESCSRSTEKAQTSSSTGTRRRRQRGFSAKCQAPSSGKKEIKNPEGLRREDRCRDWWLSIKPGRLSDRANAIMTHPWRSPAFVDQRDIC